MYYTRVMQERMFSLEEANDLVPWLEERFEAMAPLRAELVRQQEELLSLLRRRRSNGHSSSEEDIAESERIVAQLTQRLQDAVREITERGIQVRDIGRGLVDFPSRREGEVVYLCWQRGEPSIGWWHPTDTGFAGRRPL